MSRGSAPNLFDPALSADRLDPNFVQLARQPGYAPARAMMQAAFDKLGLRDPYFIEQFQGIGFSPRVWELYLFATFDSLGFEIDTQFEQPDFLVKSHEQWIAIEATTSNPGTSLPPAPEDETELREWLQGALPQKLHTTLLTKLNKSYWNKPHIKGKPLVFAIENFMSESSLHWADGALVELLLGRRAAATPAPEGSVEFTFDPIKSHEYNGRTVKSGWFAGTGATKHVSAVLWSNSGTIAKFGRMGYQDGVDSIGLRMFRCGLRYDPNPMATEPVPFSYEVGSPRESWVDGLVLIHNPNAILKLSDGTIPGAVDIRLEPDGTIAPTMPSFHVFTSQTLTFQRAASA